MTGFQIILSVFFTAITYYGYTLYKKKRSRAILPPGPSGIPILGNLPQIAKNAPIKFSQWAEQYGKLYTIYFCSKPALVVNDATLIKQIFGLQGATGSYKSDLLNIAYKGSYGLVNTDGPIWQEQRTFFIKTLRRLGFNKTTQMEPIILGEMQDLSDWIKTEMDVHGVLYLNKRLKVASGNIMWATAIGKKEITIIPELLEELMLTVNDATNTGLAFFSWLKYIAPTMSGYNGYLKACTRIQEFVQTHFDDPRRIEGHRDHDDFISAHITQVGTTTDKESSFYGEEGIKHSFGNVIALLLAGTETVASTMNWLIFYLATHPDVQTKIQEEIDDIIGDHRDPSLEDRNKMSYAQAVIEETLRMSSLVAFGFIHVLQEDVSFLQYELPKGLLLIANIYHVHSDPKVWGDPETFRPERFLEGESHPKNENFPKVRTQLKENVIAFQPGRRTCPGEPQARDIIFLMLTTILKRFRFSPENGISRWEYLEPDGGYFRIPKTLGVVANMRR